MKKKTLSKRTIAKLNSNWKDYLDQIEEYPDDSCGKGIVILVNSFSDYFNCKVLIEMLHDCGCHLPIEIWHNKNRLGSEIIAEIGSLGHSSRDLSDLVEEDVDGFIMVPLCIIGSSFEEVILLSPYLVPVTDPTILFDEPSYLSQGYLFWSDHTSTPDDLVTWDVLGLPSMDCKNLDSRCMLINKRYNWKMLKLCIYFNFFNSFSSSLLFGEQNTFMFACMALSLNFNYASKRCSILGYLNEIQSFNGISRIYFGPNTQVLFVDRSNLAWDMVSLGVKVWKILKTVDRPKGTVKTIKELNQEVKHFAIDFDEDGKMEPFDELHPGLEFRCLEIAERIKSTASYKRALFANYLSEHRYKGKHVEITEHSEKN